MGWEQRPGGHYLYHKRRIDGHVVSEYLGNGWLAELAESEHERRQEEREAERAELVAAVALDKRVAEACELGRALATAALLVSGYHQHRGAWRRRQEVDK
jgi:hypothetical protein